MHVGHVLGFLVGHRRSIEVLWADRWSLVVGAVLVLSASLARNYDGHDLIREWPVLLHGFGASIGNALVLFSLLWCVVRLRAPKRAVTDGASDALDSGSAATPTVPFWSNYLSFLGVFWMTSPMAWLYGVPWEHMLEPVEAVKANLWTLAFVSVWRIALMARVLSVAFGIAHVPTLLWTVAFGDLVAQVALAIAPTPTIDLMGGLRHPPDVEVVAEVTLLVRYVGTLALPVLLIAACIATVWIKPTGAPPTARFGPVPRGAIGIAVVGVLVWFGAGFAGQPPVRLKHDVESLIAAGKPDEAMDVLSKHLRSEFPPVWDLPPRAMRGKREWYAPLRGIRDVIERRNDVPEWVTMVYAQKSLNEAARGLRPDYFDSSSGDGPELLALTRASLVTELVSWDAVRFWAKYGADLSPSQRERWIYVADTLLAETTTPPEGPK